MKYAVFLFGFFILVSCKSQIDLKTFKLGEEISFSNNLEKGSSLYIPLTNIYSVNDISKFKYGNILIEPEKIDLKGEGMVPQNALSIVTDSSASKHYLGFELTLINEKSSDAFLELFKHLYGTPVKQYEDVESKDYKDVQYLWENKEENRIIYFKKHNEGDHIDAKNNKSFVLSKTTIIILKDGLRAQIDNSDPRNSPEKIKDILSANPNAFDILEVFKSQIPN